MPGVAASQVPSAILEKQLRGVLLFERLAGGDGARHHSQCRQSPPA